MSAKADNSEGKDRQRGQRLNQWKCVRERNGGDACDINPFQWAAITEMDAGLTASSTVPADVIAIRANGHKLMLRLSLGATVSYAKSCSISRAQMTSK